MITAVLLVPAEGDPHGLLREGPCGARPPVACWDGGRWRAWTDNGWWWPVVPDRCALVLAWDGESVAEGLDRLLRAMVPVMEKNGQAAPRWLANCPAHVALEIARLARAMRCFGTLILLDGEGRQVSDE